MPGFRSPTRKTEGPATVIQFLEIKIDSFQQCCRLSEEKLSTFQTSLRDWASRTCCTKQDLLSFLGSLSFAARVVKPGPFMLRLIDLFTTVKPLGALVTLSVEARQDILWWLEFSRARNGTALIQAHLVSSDRCLTVWPGGGLRRQMDLY